MKTFILVLSIAIIAFSIGISSAADFKVQTGFHYDWWDDTKGNKASQAYIPIRIVGRHQEFSLTPIFTEMIIARILPKKVRF